MINRSWVLIRFKLAIAATSSSSFVSSDQAKTAFEPQLLLIIHLIFAISRLQFLVLACSFDCLEELDLRGQVDRASAGRESRLHHNRSPSSHRNIGTPSPLSSGIRFPGCSVRFTSFRSLDWFCSSYLQSTKKPKKIRVRSSRPKTVLA